MVTKIYQCTVCRFEYKQDGRTQQSGRLLSFEELPLSWRCPGCGVAKNLFKEVAPAQGTADTQAPESQHNGESQ